MRQSWTRSARRQRVSLIAGGVTSFILAAVLGVLAARAIDPDLPVEPTVTATAAPTPGGKLGPR
jgi:hypothetical protein